MSKRKTTTYAATGLEILTIAFVIMKLAGIGEVKFWSWWAVLAPAWVPLALVTTIFAGYAIYIAIIVLFRHPKENKFH